MAPVVVNTVRGSAGVASLNRPKVLNSLDLEMIRLLAPQLKAWDADSAIKTIVVRGEGEKAFCAGGDVVAVAKVGKEDLNTGLEFFHEEYKLDYTIATLSKPYVALLDGIVMGGGVGISVHGKFRVATERSLFAMPETQIGLFPDVGGSYFLPKLHGGLGMYLALTGSRLKGGDLLAAGIATHFVPSDRMEDLLAALEVTSDVDATLAKFSAPAEPASYEQARATIDTCFTKDSVPGILAALEADGSEWAIKQISALRRACPVSVVVTHEQLQRGQGLDLAACLQMEYAMCHRALQDPDFYEGIRAQLIDKDRNPKWSSSSIESVDRADVIKRYFESDAPKVPIV